MKVEKQSFFRTTSSRGVSVVKNAASTVLSPEQQVFFGAKNENARKFWIPTNVLISVHKLPECLYSGRFCVL